VRASALFEVSQPTLSHPLKKLATPGSSIRRKRPVGLLLRAHLTPSPGGCPGMVELSDAKEARAHGEVKHELQLQTRRNTLPPLGGQPWSRGRSICQNDREQWQGDGRPLAGCPLLGSLMVARRRIHDESSPGWFWFLGRWPEEEVTVLATQQVDEAGTMQLYARAGRGRITSRA